jgi:hypothetical protein
MGDMVRIEGQDLKDLLARLSDTRNIWLLRIQWRGDAVAVKVNAGEWSYSLGTEQPPY